MTIMHWYTVAWLLLCAVAGALVVSKPEQFALLQPSYWKFILEPWKLTTALVATAGMVMVAPYTGDPTWDYVDGLYMSVLTYLTAPWSVGTAYRALLRREGWRAVYVACCCWLFATSWSYDLYIWLRDGAYPLTWASNIVASSFLYLMAGLLWNLQWQPGEGLRFAFMDEQWPYPAQYRSWRIVWLALPIMIVVAIVLAQFLTQP